MFVKTFKTDVTVFIGKMIMCLMSQWPQYQSLFVVNDNITQLNQRKNFQITNKLFYTKQYQLPVYHLYENIGLMSSSFKDW